MNNQSEDRVLGYVGTYPVGDYNVQTEYEYLNVVTHRGSSYVCIKEEGCIAVEPPNEEYWQLFAGKGDIGEKGEKGDTGPIGPKPINGEDYNTEAEQEEFKDKVVADSKADLEKYITEKETQLDNYTKDKETKLDDYVTDTVKPAIDTYVTDTTKKDIDKYEKEKEKVLDTYTDTKKTEIDNYATNISKPALDQYEKDKEAELETAKNTAISEYDAHVESVLTETEDLFNALDTEKANGTELYIEDAKPCRVINAGISGMYKQGTTTGANILDISDMLFGNSSLEQNGLKATLNNDSSITINGTATETTYLKKSLKSVLEDGNYYFYNFNNINQSIESYYMLIQGRKSTGYTPTDYYNVRGYQAANFIKDTETYNASFDCMFVFKKGFVANNLKLYPVISKTAQTGFEPYTGKIASPSPDYPQAIEQVDSVKLNIRGKNLCDGINQNYYISNNVDICGKVTGNSGLAIDVQDKAYVTVSTKITQNRYRIACINSLLQEEKATTAAYRGVQKDNTSATVTINTTGYKYLIINATVLSSILVEDGSVATEYEPYQNQTINIDLKGNKLCAVSDTIKDKLLIDRNGNVALKKNVEKNIFDGTKKWKKSTYTENTIFYLTNTQKAKFPDVGICNYFPVKKVWNVDILGLELYDLNNIRVGLTRKSEIQTEDAFNEWLTTHNLEVYYALATPELIDLGQLPELLKTFNGINNIWAETNLGNTEIEIEYVQDVKKLLEKQNARLDSIEALLSTTETSALLLDNMQNDLESEVE